MVRALIQELSASEPPSGFHVLSMKASTPSVSVSFFFLGGAVFLVLILIVLIVLWKLLKVDLLLKMVQLKGSSGVPDYMSGNLQPICYFDYRTLKKATKNFHSKNQLGRGGFGPVYQGVLDDGRMIAVKQLSLGKSRQGESEFLAEVKMITNIQHKNLVRLIGCCSEGSERLLVYEYMKNKSLDCIIYGGKDLFLNWTTRLQIIMGIARGLQYLHEESHFRIVHRDIKASNILLDDKFQPRIGDFGLARFFPEDQAYLSTTVAGTLGYTAPEYAIRGELSEKADTYSFGVLVLEIISCRKNTDLELPSEMQYLPEYAWKLYKKEKLIDLVDPKLQEGGFSEGEVLHVCRIALLCLQQQPNLRPPMSQVVSMLTRKTEPTTMPTKPAFMNRRCHQDNSSVSWESVSLAQNDWPNVPPSSVSLSEHPSPSVSISMLQHGSPPCLQLTGFQNQCDGCTNADRN